ncbi:MAG: hypothetical protein FJ096_12805 [Deltaproteobacteria bacterium]|nr:hypothetical protein [Deltaproteobacteria bacterium]
MRCSFVQVLVVVAGLAMSAGVLAGPRRAEPQEPLHRGSELIAVEDTQLLRAYLPKGSRVTVVDLTSERGKPAVVSVALPDGHVVHGVSYERLSRVFQPSKG